MNKTSLIWLVIVMAAAVAFLLWYFLRPCTGSCPVEVAPVADKSAADNQANDNAASAVEGLLAQWEPSSIADNVWPNSAGQGDSGAVYGATRSSQGEKFILDFDGRDDYVAIDSDFSDLSQGSIAVWFKVNDIPGDRIAPILQYGASEPCPGQYNMSHQGLIIEAGHSPIQPGSERLYFTIYADGCDEPSFCYDSGRDIEEGRWYQFVAVVGADYNTGYLNGEEMTDRRYNFGDQGYSQFFAAAVKHDVLWLGRGIWMGQIDYFNGSIGETRIYDKPLTADEVRELYEETK